MAAAKKESPRYEAGAGAKREPKTRTVELPELGMSVVIQAPRVKAYTDLEEATADQTEFDKGVEFVALALVEPDLTAEELKPEIKEWDIGDWMILQAEVTELLGLNQRSALRKEREFRGPEDE